MTAPEQAALARNDRFLVEVVEGWSLCPFARATRLAGQLAREVVFGEDATRFFCQPICRDCAALPDKLARIGRLFAEAPRTPQTLQ